MQQVAVSTICSLTQERENKKKSAKAGGKGASQKGAAVANWEDFVQSPEQPVPLFVEKCVQFIELEGLDSEGIYRVPGNKVHVEHLTARFKEGTIPCCTPYTLYAPYSGHA